MYLGCINKIINVLTRENSLGSIHLKHAVRKLEINMANVICFNTQNGVGVTVVSCLTHLSLTVRRILLRIEPMIIVCIRRKVFVAFSTVLLANQLLYKSTANGGV